MSGPERPYISFGQTDRPPADEHHDGVELLVRAVLKGYVDALLEQARVHSETLLPSVAEQIMEKAYYTSLFGELRLMGQAEAVEYLGLKHKQQLIQLRGRVTHPFPQPVAELRMGPVWLAEDVEQWAEGWDRRPGRPRRETGDGE